MFALVKRAHCQRRNLTLDFIRRKKKEIASIVFLLKMVKTYVICIKSPLKRFDKAVWEYHNYHYNSRYLYGIYACNCYTY